MTIRDIIDYVQSDINSKRYWNDERLINLINVVQMKMCSSLKLMVRDFYKFESSTEQRYLMPFTYVSIEYLWYSNAGAEGQINLCASPREIYGKHSTPDSTTSATPYKGFVWESSGRKELWIYPIFDTEAVDIFMWFYGTPPRITSENDTPILPAEMHIHLVEACINRTRRVDEQLVISEELLLYNSIINECKSIETTSTVIQDRSQVAKDGSNFNAFSNFGLLDNSQAGINWEE